MDEHSARAKMCLSGIMLSHNVDFKGARDVFHVRSLSIVKGKRLTKANMKPGNINFIGAISTNNGVREKIATENPYTANCITVNYNGMVCSLLGRHVK